MGEKKNCMAAKTVPKRPNIFAALEVSPLRKPSMSRGNHAESEHVEGYGEEDEDSCGAAASGWLRHKCDVGRYQFGLGHQRIRHGDRFRRIWRRLCHGN